MLLLRLDSEALPSLGPRSPIWVVGRDGACLLQWLTVAPTVDSHWVLSPQPRMMLIRPSDTAQNLSHASGSGHICVFKYDRLAAVRGSHPSSPVPHRVTLICGPAKAVMSGLCLPPASWLHGLCFGVWASTAKGRLGGGVGRGGAKRPPCMFFFVPGAPRRDHPSGCQLGCEQMERGQAG